MEVKLNTEGGEEHVQSLEAEKPAPALPLRDSARALSEELATSCVKKEVVRCRTNVKRDVMKRGALSHLTPRERSREYKRLVGRVDKHCSACDININRCGFAKHCTTKKHLLAEEVIKLRAQLQAPSTG